MQIARLVFAGSLAALAAVATPALAKSSDRQKADDKSTPTTSSTCQAYQQAADGTWTQLPCGEMGPNESTQHRAVTKGAEEDGH